MIVAISMLFISRIIFIAMASAVTKNPIAKPSAIDAIIFGTHFNYFRSPYYDDDDDDGDDINNCERVNEKYSVFVLGYFC